MHEKTRLALYDKRFSHCSGYIRAIDSTKTLRWNWYILIISLPDALSIIVAI